jgi:hypothetical protein
MPPPPLQRNDDLHRRRSCCGTFSAQRTRLAKLDALIAELSAQDTYHRRLKHAQAERDKVLKWFEAHAHR